METLLSHQKPKKKKANYHLHMISMMPISHHKDILVSTLKRQPSRLELFGKTHRTKKPHEGTSNTDYITHKTTIIADAYKDKMVIKYGDDIDSHPNYDHEIWVEVTRGIKKGRVLGFGFVYDPHSFLIPSQEAPSATSNNVEVIVERSLEEMREELKAERDEIESKKQEIAKMYNEILKNS